MKTRALFFALTGLVLTVAAATSCVADRLASVPSIVRAPAPSNADIRANIEQEISAINFLLSHDGVQATLAVTRPVRAG